MFKIVSIGTSFNHGLGLHFYNRKKNNKVLNYQLEPEEQEFNLKNVFHSVLADKLKAKSEIFFGKNLGLDTSFDNIIEGIKRAIDNDINKEIKIVIWQLSNAEKDFFIYNNKIYRLNFENEELVLKSRQKLVDSIDESIKNDFVNKLDEEIQLWLSNTSQWRKKNVPWFINKINELNNYLLDNNIILKVISYYEDYNKFIESFSENVYCTIKIDNKEYINIHDFAWKEKLMICHDIETIDQHPNFKGHQIVAESLYDGIVNHPLYKHF